jgi:hypothetical protein
LPLHAEPIKTRRNLPRMGEGNKEGTSLRGRKTYKLEKPAEASLS